MAAQMDLHAWEEAFLEQLEPTSSPSEDVLVQEALAWMVQRPEPWEVAQRVALVWRTVHGGGCPSFWLAGPSGPARIRALYGRAKQLPPVCWRQASGALNEHQVRRHVYRVFRACEGRAAEHRQELEEGKVRVSPAGEALVARLVVLLFRGAVGPAPVEHREPGDVVMATKRAFLLASAFCPARVFYANDSDLGSLFGEKRAAATARRGKLFDPLGIKIGGQKGEDARQVYADLCTQRHSARVQVCGQTVKPLNVTMNTNDVSQRSNGRECVHRPNGSPSGVTTTAGGPGGEPPAHDEMEGGEV